MTRVGINIVSSNLHFTRIENRELIENSFDYFYEVKTISDNNGNGLLHLIILNREFQQVDFEYRKWKIKSPIKLAFNWSGIFHSFGLIDQSGEIREMKGTHNGVSIFKHGDSYDYYIKDAFGVLFLHSFNINWEHNDLVAKKISLETDLQEVNVKINMLETSLRIEAG